MIRDARLCARDVRMRMQQLARVCPFFSADAPSSARCLGTPVFNMLTAD